MRLIDADAFDKTLIEAQAECKKNGGNFRFGVLGNVRANLALFPTVDCPEIVRCKDCKHIEHMYSLDELNGKKCYVCRKHPFTGLREEYWFCADGERKEGR